MSSSRPNSGPAAARRPRTRVRPSSSGGGPLRTSLPARYDPRTGDAAAAPVEVRVTPVCGRRRGDAGDRRPPPQLRLRVHGVRADRRPAARVAWDAAAAVSLACPDLAFLELGVWDAGAAGFRAAAVLPVPDLRAGFRSVDLGPGAADLDALLCHFAFPS